MRPAVTSLNCAGHHWSLVEVSRTHCPAYLDRLRLPPWCRDIRLSFRLNAPTPNRPRGELHKVASWYRMCRKCMLSCSWRALVHKRTNFPFTHQCYQLVPYKLYSTMFSGRKETYLSAWKINMGCGRLFRSTTTALAYLQKQWYVYGGVICRTGHRNKHLTVTPFYVVWWSQ